MLQTILCHPGQPLFVSIHPLLTHSMKSKYVYEGLLSSSQPNALL